MKNTIKRTTVSVHKQSVQFALLALTLTGTHAATATEPGWYVGANLGQSEARIDTSRVVNRQLGNGFTNIRVDTKESRTGFKVFSGYQFGSNFAIEGGYFDLGDFSYRSYMTPQSVLTGHSTVRGLNIDLVGILPLGEKLSAFGRLGMARTQVKDKYRGYGAVPLTHFSSRNREDSHKYGLGLQYDFTDNFALRLEAERYDVKNAMFSKNDIDMYSVGVVYRFGQAAEPVRAPVSTAPPLVRKW